MVHESALNVVLAGGPEYGHLFRKAELRRTVGSHFVSRKNRPRFRARKSNHRFIHNVRQFSRQQTKTSKLTLLNGTLFCPKYLPHIAIPHFGCAGHRPVHSCASLLRLVHLRRLFALLALLTFVQLPFDPCAERDEDARPSRSPRKNNSKNFWTQSRRPRGPASQPAYTAAFDSKCCIRRPRISTSNPQLCGETWRPRSAFANKGLSECWPLL